MNWTSYSWFGIALLLVIGLILGAAALMQRLGIGGAPLRVGRDRRLRVIESLVVDPKRRLVLVRRDTVEHLILLGPSGDLVVGSGFAPADAPPAQGSVTDEP